MSIKEVLLAMGLKDTGGSRQNIARHIERLEIDTSHFPGRSWWKGKTRELHSKWRPDDEVFAAGVPFNANTKRRFLELVEYKCVICGLNEWLGKTLVLQVDHIDGDRMNNVLDNLRLLCPNCHSQTETYAKQKKYLEKSA